RDRDALSGGRRGPQGHRRDRGGDWPAGRRSGSLRRRAAVGRDPRIGRRAALGPHGRVTLEVRHEVLRLALRDPFVIARSEHGAGRSITTVIVELRDDRFPDIVGLGEGYPDRFYGETPEPMTATTLFLVEVIGEVE